MVARGNLAEETSSSGGGDEIRDGRGVKAVGGVPPGAWRAFSGLTVGRDDEEEGPSRRKTKVRGRRSEGGLRQAAGAPCVTAHLHMVVELGGLWRCSGAGAC